MHKITAQLILAFFLIPQIVKAEGLKYKFIAEIPVERDGGWDYLSVDEAAHRLYVVHEQQITVIDTETNLVAGEIKDTPGVHGLAIAAELGRGYSSNGKEDKISVIDLKNLSTIQKIDSGNGPDAILYNPMEKEVYAFNGKSKNITVLNAKSGNSITTIPLAGKPEFAAVDPALHRVYVNLEDRNSLVAIDSVKHKVVATWPLAPGDEPAGLAIDTRNHRLFVGCHNKMLLMVDGKNGKILDHAEIGSGVDSNWYDPTTQLAFSSNGEGNITIINASDRNKLLPTQTLPTAPRARTMALDTTTHKIYLATANFEPVTAPKTRPKAIPGTFKILVFGLANDPK